MRIPKRYGESKETRCPFCGKLATAKNAQGIPVCAQHKAKSMPEMRCSCGEWLELRTGRFGPYFFCLHCGNINFRKGLDMNPSVLDRKPVERVVRSDELDFL